MHELSLVAELVEVCQVQAQRRGRPVTAVHVRYATTIPADALHQAFAMLAAGTELEGAALHAQPFERVLDCPGCGYQGRLGHDDVLGGSAVCPRCDLVTPLPGGAELELIELS